MPWASAANRRKPPGDQTAGRASAHVVGAPLTFVVCAAEVLTMLGFSAYAVLLAPLRDL
ncbi:hypothetical protein [Caldovatus sediminis]|uniref:hypothetical protein n=1 Tax=Caldovatus sediminis TaxID=2041189 RepID=UPI00166996E9|nr:hypothetical protein [Caldovatus sediminis]